VKVIYDGPESMFTWFGPSGTRYVFVGRIPTDVKDEADLHAFRTAGGFKVVEDVRLGDLPKSEIKEPAPEAPVGKKRTIAKKESEK
jgi:hypothetical protein